MGVKQGKLRDLCFRRQWALPKYSVAPCYSGFICTLAVAGQEFSGLWAETDEEAKENTAEKALKDLV